VTLRGADLEGFEPGHPAASVRLLLPDPAAATLALPMWNGNEFLRDDGGRPPLRTLTPLRFDPDHLELDVEVVLHDGGTLSDWAASAGAGDPVALSGPGRGHDVDTDARTYVLVGDESAIPAITTLLRAIPDATEIVAIVEVAHPDGRVELPEHPRLSLEWIDADPTEPPGSGLVRSLALLRPDPETVVWAAGEAAAVQRMRGVVADTDVVRSRTVIRGYWKVARAERGGPPS